jgi:hypothetical protein
MGREPTLLRLYLAIWQPLHIKPKLRLRQLRDIKLQKLNEFCFSDRHPHRSASLEDDVEVRAPVAESNNVFARSGFLVPHALHDLSAVFIFELNLLSERRLH